MAAKLDNPAPVTEETFQLLRDLRGKNLPPAHSYWLAQAEMYAEQGAVNPAVLRFINDQIVWHHLFHSKFVYQTTKRAFDVGAAIFLLALLSPILLLIGVLIALNSKGPVLFSQVRIGRGCQPFRIYKFRTMGQGAPRIVSFLDSKTRLRPTKAHRRTSVFGAFLRKSSLDELPQLLNVVKGDMSLIGPRPLTPCDSSVTPPEHMVRFAVNPGMTGYWQATAVQTTAGLDKLRMDAEYAAASCWALDLRLLLRTFGAVIARMRM